MSPAFLTIPGRIALSLAILTAFSANSTAAARSKSGNTKLRHRVLAYENIGEPDQFNEWPIFMPADPFVKARKGTLKIQDHSFRFGWSDDISPRGYVLDHDSDGDMDLPVRSYLRTVVELKWKAPDRSKKSYAIRFLRRDPNQRSEKVYTDSMWYASAGVMEGKILGTKIRLVDGNGNGRFDEFGADAMCLGSCDVASFLSPTIHVKGELYRIQVTPDGSEIQWDPLDEETGLLDVTSGYNSKGHLAGVVIAGISNGLSFEVAETGKPIRLPVGRYRVVGGKIERGNQTARFRGNEMPPFEVSTGETTALEWGGPLTAKFEVTEDDGRLLVKPGSITLVGESGEEYYDWLTWPEWRGSSKPPTLETRRISDGKLLHKERMGTCSAGICRRFELSTHKQPVEVALTYTSSLFKQVSGSVTIDPAMQ